MIYFIISISFPSTDLEKKSFFFNKIVKQIKKSCLIENQDPTASGAKQRTIIAFLAKYFGDHAFEARDLVRSLLNDNRGVD